LAVIVSIGRSDVLLRGLLVWLLLLVLAFLNGGLRELLLIPNTGDLAGRALSTVILSAAIVVLTWLTMPWVAPTTARDALALGAVWLALTLAFEFLAGHYLFGNPWERLLEDYDVLRGRIWVLVLITTALAPLLVSRARGLV
jgi:hypothetical protein